MYNKYQSQLQDNLNNQMANAITHVVDDFITELSEDTGSESQPINETDLSAESIDADVDENSEGKDHLRSQMSSE